MTKEQRKKCHKIIHTASVSAATVGAGLAQLPGSDNAVITPIQVIMTISLGGVFGKKLKKSIAHSVIATQLAATTGRAISQFLIGWIPGVGNALNASTAAVVTEALGWAIANDFDKNR